MPDAADIANDIAEREWAALTRVAGRPETPRVAGANCVECGEPIEPGRLAVLPHTRKCAFCAGAKPHV